MSRRQKTYSSLGGYGFQYVYAGYRQVASPDATDYVFRVASQRATVAPLCIRVPRSSVERIESESGRDLSAREQYALAKLKLFRTLDELEPDPRGRFPLEETSELTAEEAIEFWELLGL